MVRWSLLLVVVATACSSRSSTPASDQYTPVTNGQCLPARDAGTYDACELLVSLPTPGPESECMKVAGLSTPDTTVVTSFQEWRVDSARGDAGALLTFPVCVVQRLPTDVGETCAISASAGWCELPGAACASAVVLSNELTSEVKGATYVLRCPPG
jgi:hypothetical protein